MLHFCRASHTPTLSERKTKQNTSTSTARQEAPPTSPVPVSHSVHNCVCPCPLSIIFQTVVNQQEAEWPAQEKKTAQRCEMEDKWGWEKYYCRGTEVQKIMRREKEAESEGCDCGTMLAVKLFSSSPSLPPVMPWAVSTQTERNVKQMFNTFF